MGHLHPNVIFAEPQVETARKSLRPRAGRNLPDKEFRYLRTVRYGRRLPGLQFTASLALTIPLNLPAPGRRQALYVRLRVRRALCFW